MLTAKQIIEHFGPSSTVNSWYHYTSIDAIINGIIVQNPKPQKEICLWATHNRYMNDPSEFSIGSSLVEGMIREIKNRFHIDIRQEWTHVLESYQSCFFTCFSENSDSLPMWNMYGNNGQGVALEFENGMPELDNEYIVQCEYDINNVIPKARELLDLGIEYVATYIALLPFILKASAYQHEKEIRYVGNFGSIPTYFRCRNDIAIPYKKIYLEKELLKSVTIGPSANFEQVKQSLRLFLDNKGFQNVPIKQSLIPYRCN